MALPLLFSFLGGGLAKSGVLGAAGSFLANPLIASAIGSGVGTLAETGDIRKALMGGLGSFAGGKLLGGLMGDSIPGAMQSPLPGQSVVGSGANAMTTGTPLYAQPGMTGSALLPPPAETGGIMGGRMGDIASAGMQFAQSGEGIGSALGSMVPSMMGDRSGGGGSGAPDILQQRAMQRSAQVPGPDFRPGVSPEFDYGVSAPYTAEYMERYAPQRRALGGPVDNPYAQNYAQERGQMLAGLGVDQPPMRMADGGTVQRMVPGYGPVAMQAGGIAEMGAMAEPAAQPNEREVISGAVAAIMGQHPQPEVALGMFLQQYGEEALRDLVDRVQSGEFQDTQERFASGENGEVVGPGDGSGVDDMVPAVVDGQGDVLLSDGEFVLRKDATDALNAEFGPEFMDRMNSAGTRAPEVVRQMVTT